MWFNLIKRKIKPLNAISPLQHDDYQVFIVIKKQVEAQDICSFYIKPEHRSPLKPFNPGQYVRIKCWPRDEAYPLIRAYSLSEQFKRQYYRITVKKNKKHECPNKSLSEYLCHEVQVGHYLHVNGPRGDFYINHENPLVFIAAGIGITPILAMIKSLLATKRPMRLYYCVKNSNHLPFQQELMHIKKRIDDCTIWFSQPTIADIQQKKFDFSGRLNTEKILQKKRINERYYICGPNDFIEEVQSDLLHQGIAANTIHTDYFAPKNQSHKELQEPRYDICLKRSNLTKQWRGQYSNLLEFVKANQIKAQASCRQGICDLCQCILLDGIVTDYNQNETMSGKILLCTTRPKTNLILDL